MSNKLKAARKPTIAVMSSYNRALDCVALSLSLAKAGRITAAASAFKAALNDPSLTAAITILNKSNQIAVQATAQRLAAANAAAKAVKAGKVKAELDEDLDDDEIDALLNGDGEDLDADVDEDDEDIDLDDGDDEDEDGEEDALVEDDEDLEADADEDVDGDESLEDFGKVVSSMLQRKRTRRAR